MAIGAVLGLFLADAAAGILSGRVFAMRAEIPECTDDNWRRRPDLKGARSLLFPNVFFRFAKFLPISC